MTSVAIIGPVSPYRGGIAQHTEMLFRALQHVADRVCLCSFSRQYPKLLFPGESDIDGEKSPLTNEFEHYVIDSINPLTWREAASKNCGVSPRRRNYSILDLVLGAMFRLSDPQTAEEQPHRTRSLSQHL